MLLPQLLVVILVLESPRFSLQFAGATSVPLENDRDVLVQCICLLSGRVGQSAGHLVVWSVGRSLGWSVASLAARSMGWPLLELDCLLADAGLRVRAEALTVWPAVKMCHVA